MKVGRPGGSIAVTVAKETPTTDDVQPDGAIAEGAPARRIKTTAEGPDGAQSVREPGAPYSTDIFGKPLPASAGAGKRARPKRAGLLGDVQPATGLRDTTAPDGEYAARTIVGSEVSRKLGADRIETPEHAAAATRYLYKSAVERFDGIVTDASGKPLAVVGGFKGALTQTSVYQSTLLAEAVRVPGAAAIWFSHNHPSGVSSLSRADEHVNQTLTDAFSGSGIEPRGLLAIGDGSFTHVDARGGDYTSGIIPQSGAATSVPVVERELLPSATALPMISAPQDTKDIARAYYDRAKAPGLILLDSQHGVAAWVPVSPLMTGKLRGTSGLNAIYRAVSEANAGSAIIVHGGELNERGDLPVGQTPALNIAMALRKVEVRILDIIDMSNGVAQSATERGDDLVGSALYAQGDPADGGSTLASAQAEIASLFGKTADNVVTVAATADGLPPSIAKVMKAAGANAVTMDKQHIYIVADRVPKGGVRGLVLHELGVHVGMDKATVQQLTKQVEQWAKGSGPLAENAKRALDAASKSSSTHRDEETAAYMVQILVDSGVDPTTGPPILRRFFASFVRAVKAALRAIGLDVQMTPQDMVDYAYGVAKMALRNTAPEAAQGAQFSQTKDGIITVKRIGQQWAVILNQGTGNDQHLGQYDSEAAADEAAERIRSQERRAASAGRRWWIENQAQLLQSTSLGRLDSRDRARAAKSTLDARSSAVRTAAEGRLLTQLPDRAGYCFLCAAEASAVFVGDMVIGEAPGDSGPIWHAVVMRDGMVYDPTFARWFEPGIYESLGFKSKKTPTHQRSSSRLRRKESRRLGNAH